jgi:hypothetical protein
MFLGSRYVDRLEKRGEEWKFINRAAVYDWYRKAGHGQPWTDAWWTGMDLNGISLGKQADDYSWKVFANGPLPAEKSLQSHNAVVKPK